ncbi:MAG: hypothetical protein ACK4KW_03740 [Gemmobacter sp.]
MFRRLSLTAAALMMTSAAAIADARTVSDVRVTADLAAVQNPEAGAFWANVEADLTNAIAERVADRTAEDGVGIEVRIDGLALANSFDMMWGGASAEDVRMDGLVLFQSPGRSDAYNLTVSLARPATVDGVPVLARDSALYYDAMVAAFADHVVASLD